MPEYQYPGVYIEEIPSGNRPIGGVSTSTAGFVGATERGPLGARLVTSFREYQDHYGGEAGPDAYLPYAVRGFFQNGGRRLFVARVVSEEATCASVEFGPHFTVQAVAPGAWGTRVFACIDDAVHGAPGFRLRVAYYAGEPVGDPRAWFAAAGAPAPTHAEEFDGLVLDADLPDHFEARLAASSLVRLRRDPTAPAGAFPEYGLRRLQGGADGAPLATSDYEGDAAAAEARGLAALASYDCREVSLVYAPGASVEVARRLVAQCEALRHRFAILDGPPTLPAGFEPRQAIAESSRAALYAPWLVVADLVGGGGRRNVPPGGHVAGIYARTDEMRGVHKAPANETIVGVFGLTATIDAVQQEPLNLRGVNALREFPGRGLRVWGARTLSADPEWKYVNVRRLFMYLERSIEEGTTWAVFEPNDARTRACLREAIGNFLRTAWRDGMLLGRTEREAFYVHCDRTTMTQNDLDHGRLICEIGAAAVRPAEFIVIRFDLRAGAGTA